MNQARYRGIKKLRYVVARPVWLIAIVFYVFALISVLLLNQIGPEHFWPAIINLYLPQFAWGLPTVLLFPLGFWVRGNQPWLPALGLLPVLMVLGPLMGLRGYLPSIQPPVDVASPVLRVMTFNIEGAKNDAGVILELLKEQSDVVFFQEFRPEFEKPFRSVLKGWAIEVEAGLAIASRLPISEFKHVDLPKLSDDQWKRPAYVRAVLKSGGTEIAVYNTHLSTPRPGFEALRNREALAIEMIESNARDRIAQGQALANALATETLPTLVGGDFNAPEASLVLAPILKANFRNTFSEAGKGYGYTKGHDLRFGFSFVRIDHLFVSTQFAVLTCSTGDKSASDHRPVIAQIALAKR
jgi:vancomycin resistance protein VanJ